MHPGRRVPRRPRGRRPRLSLSLGALRCQHALHPTPPRSVLSFGVLPEPRHQLRPTTHPPANGRRGLGSPPEQSGAAPGRLPISPPGHPALLCHLPGLMATQGADPSRAGKGRTHFTRARCDALPLLGAPPAPPVQPRVGLGARTRKARAERSPSWSAAAHKALHLLAFQAPPWAALFRGSRMPPSVVGGTVRLLSQRCPLLRISAASSRPLATDPSGTSTPGVGGRESTPVPRGSGQRCSLRSTTSPGRSATGSGAHAHPRSGRIGSRSATSRAAGEPGRRHAPT